MGSSDGAPSRRPGRQRSRDSSRTTRGAEPAGHIPAQPRAFVSRPRLDAAIDEAVGRRLTVVVAPAGCGKTLTLAHWAMQTARHIRWFTADPSDAAGSLAGLRDAIAAVGAGVVVIDDAHHLPAAAWDLLATRLDGEPDADGTAFVLATRRDVPLSLVVLELTGQVSVLRASTLRFTDEEARELVSAHVPDVAPDDAEALQERAQGWAAALVLGARALAGARDRASARDALAHTQRPVVDYLLGEVFSTLPALTRHVLLCTADVDPVTEGPALVLSGDAEAAARLSELAADGLLVTTYVQDEDGERAWRYHPLLRELLRRRVTRDPVDQALARGAHARAARHYAVHGPATAALRHAALAGADDVLIRVLVDEGPALALAGREDALIRALGTLPDVQAERHPALLGVSALARRGIGDTETAGRLAPQVMRAAEDVRQAVTAADRPPRPDELTLLCDAALLEVWQARAGWAEAARAIAHARQVLGYGGPEQRRPHPVGPARATWLLHELAGAEILTFQFAEAGAHLGEALAGAHALGSDRLLASTLATRALLELLLGRTQTAAATATSSLEAARRSGKADTFQARAHVVIGWAALHRLDLADAQAAVRSIDAFAGPPLEPLVAALATVLRAVLTAESGDVDAARRLVSDLRPMPDAVPLYLGQMFGMYRARLALLAGDVRAARQETELMREYGWTELHTLFSALLDESDDPRTLRRQLAPLTRAAPGDGRNVLAAIGAVRILTAQLHADAPSSEVRAAVHDLLDRIAPELLVLPLVFTGPPDPALDSVLRADAEGQRPHPVIGDVIRALDRYRRTHAAAAVVRRHDLPATRRDPAGDPGRGVVQLTERETDVLRELALGGSYVDVARTLYVTENTVKTHITSLYRKLGVDRRADALRQARELGLLDDTT